MKPPPPNSSGGSSRFFRPAAPTTSSGTPPARGYIEGKGVPTVTHLVYSSRKFQSVYTHEGGSPCPIDGIDTSYSRLRSCSLRRVCLRRHRAAHSSAT